MSRSPSTLGFRILLYLRYLSASRMGSISQYSIKGGTEALLTCLLWRSFLFGFRTFLCLCLCNEKCCTYRIVAAVCHSFICMTANEFISTHNYRFTLDIAVYYIALVFYCIFNVPILFGVVNDFVFLISIGIAIVAGLALCGFSNGHLKLQSTKALGVLRLLSGFQCLWECSIS
jgi:hypothetical protein